MARELKQVEAALAHDLNNFLQVIMGNLELLRRRGEFVPEIVQAALQATRHAAQLADTGSGMPPELLTQAFEPLLSSTEGDRPAGLGLHIVNRCIQQAGGRVELVSGASGTSVKLYLPEAT